MVLVEFLGCVRFHRHRRGYCRGYRGPWSFGPVLGIEPLRHAWPSWSVAKPRSATPFAPLECPECPHGPTPIPSRTLSVTIFSGYRPFGDHSSWSSGLSPSISPSASPSLFPSPPPEGVPYHHPPLWPFRLC